MRFKKVSVIYIFLFLNGVVPTAQENNKICEIMRDAITSLPYKCVDEIYPSTEITP